MCICNPTGDSWQHELVRRARTSVERESKMRQYEKECRFTEEAICAFVPIQWRGLICLCHDPNVRLSRSEADNAQCGTCAKASRFGFAYCSDCKQFYYRAFDHHSLPIRGEGVSLGVNNDHGDGLGIVSATLPDGNRTRGRCWPCLVKKYGTIEGDVPPPSWATPFVLDREAFLAAEPVDPFAGLF